LTALQHALSMLAPKHDLTPNPEECENMPQMEPTSQKLAVAGRYMSLGREGGENREEWTKSVAIRILTFLHCSEAYMEMIIKTIA
jgi:hypothetical protein